MLEVKSQDKFYLRMLRNYQIEIKINTILNKQILYVMKYLKCILNFYISNYFYNFTENLFLQIEID